MKLIIVGAGKQAELVYQAFKEDYRPTAGGIYSIDAHPYEPVAFAVEAAHMGTGGKTVLFGLPIIATEGIREYANPKFHGYYAFHVAITFDKLNATRARLYKQMCEWGYQPASSIAPSAVVPDTANVGEHLYCGPLNNIDEYVTIGNCVYLHTLNHIGHHSTIRDNVFISSGVTISGMCDIGENTFIGVGANIAHGVKIGARCIIGAGTYINRDVPDDSLVKRSGDKPDGRKSSEVTL